MTDLPPDCPGCGATGSVPIVLGMPTPEAEAMAARGELHLGGCCIFGGGLDPVWSCRVCGRRHGFREDRYPLFEHRHRFAAWAAARAASRGWKGGRSEIVERALMQAGPYETLLQPQVTWPDEPESFDSQHRDWCREMGELFAAGDAPATYGRVAKVVAVYLKGMVVAGEEANSGLSHVAHPPIDAILLRALARDPQFDDGPRKLWRETTWTTLDEPSYFAVIDSLRAEGLDRPAFWMIERYWRP